MTGQKEEHGAWFSAENVPALLDHTNQIAWQVRAGGVGMAANFD